MALGLVLSAPAFAAQTYTLDTLHSAPTFEFKHLGITTQSGRFNRVAGSVTLDPGARKGSVTYEVETSTLNMGYGAEGPESPGYQLFDVGHFPKITFKSSKLAFDKAGVVVAADGELSLLGVTRPLTVQVQHFQCSISDLTKKPLCTADVTATVKRSEFGMLRFIPSISDEVQVHVPIEAYQD